MDRLASRSVQAVRADSRREIGGLTARAPSEPPGTLGVFFATNFRNLNWCVTAPQKGRDLLRAYFQRRPAIKRRENVAIAVSQYSPGH
jgi:hypothetical protein